MLFRIDKKIVAAYPELYSLISMSLGSIVINYILHSNYRKATNLVPWLKKQVDEAQDDVEFVKLVDSIPSSKDFDVQMKYILLWGKNRNWMTYIGDNKSVWKMSEYWQTYLETFGLKTGDCEDGAIMMYVIARLKGVPANRLLLMAGSVNGGGHCWLAYRPNEYPLNWAFLDWCYWFDGRTMTSRNLYYINNQKIYSYDSSGVRFTTDKECYLSIWFGFNDERSYRKIVYDSSLR